MTSEEIKIKVIPIILAMMQTFEVSVYDLGYTLHDALEKESYERGTN